MVLQLDKDNNFDQELDHPDKDEQHIEDSFDYYLSLDAMKSALGLDTIKFIAYINGFLRKF